MKVLRTFSVLLILCTTLVSGWKSLMTRLPNGNQVPDPCDPARIWEGVGHLKPGGWGARNQFGIDFRTHSLTWSKEVCMLDSDKDGRTNGEELGDPSCDWTPSSNVTLMSVNITHPGICEPIGSPNCKDVNSWFLCPEREASCEAINTPGTQNVTIKFPTQTVPLNETSHSCMIFEFPQDGDFHIVAAKPVLDNTKIMHHIMVYGCKDDVQPEYTANRPYECPLAFDKACRDVIAVWLLGSENGCANKDSGFRIGSNGYKRGGIQVHWENPELLANEKDASGMTFYYTANSSRQDSGILQVGQGYMVIPPGEATHTETALCTGNCTQRKFAQDIHITFAFNHMHYLGKEMMIEHLRGGVVINNITAEQDYKYDHPTMFKHDVPIAVKPSDEIRTTCVYNSTSRTKTTRGGSGYTSEMCLGFLTFYPKQAIQAGNPACISWKSITACKFELDATINGCDFRNVHNLSNPETKTIYDRVTNHCRPFGPCYKDCLAVVSDVKKLPCFRGDIWEWSRDKILTKRFNDTVLNDWFRFYAGFDSCSKQATTAAFGAGNMSNGLLTITANFHAMVIGILVAILY